jgi:cytochrome c peroxidase
MSKINQAIVVALSIILSVSIYSCQKKAVETDPFEAITATFGTKINPYSLANYANQGKPSYITKDNTGANPISNAKATLGRVLFYDKQLSINNTISCGSCHLQQFAFSDTAVASLGVENGRTGRHSMRLVNARFSDEVKFFWDERAATLEQQSTKPFKIMQKWDSAEKMEDPA